MGHLAHRTVRPLGLIAALLVAAPALAQPVKPPTAPPTTRPDPARLAEAKRLYDRGIKLFKEGLYREALAAFVAAREQSPRESIQRNIAQTYRELHDLPRAHDAYVELLDTFGASLKPRDVEQIKQVIDELRQLTATVELSISEREAAVAVDGDEVGQAPLARPVRLSAGRHKLTVTRAGFSTFATDLDLRAGEAKKVDVRLTREVVTGHLAVTADGESPAGVVLLVDGAEVGALPWEGDVPPGPHELTIKGAGVQMAPRRITVAKATRSDVSIHLERTTARLIIEVQPAQARITVDDKAVGVGAWDAVLPEGRHTLVVSLDGYESFTQVLALRGGETRELRSLILRSLSTTLALPPARPPSRLYSRAFLFGRFGTSHTQAFADPCDITDIGGTCTGATAPVGGGLGLQVGYTPVKHLGIEGFAMATYDHRSSTATFAQNVTDAQSPTYVGAARTEELTVHRYGGMLGVGVRGSTDHELVRLTLGLSGGVSIQQSFYRNTQASLVGDYRQTFSSEMTTYVAPMMMLDGGLLIGNTPGSKLYVGAMMVMEFLSSTQSATAADSSHNGFTESAPGVKVPIGNERRLEQHTQVFFGPVLGGQFGQ